MQDPVISKSRYISGLQCPKLLWYIFNERSAFPPVDPGTQAVFDQGHDVGALARTLFPGGFTVEGDIPFDEVESRSLDLLKHRKPLFEPGFRYRQVIARADILRPVGSDEWDLVEVKSSTKVADPYLDDVAIQRYCYSGAGIRIRRCVIMHVNKLYVKAGPVNPAQLFNRVDVTEPVAGKLEDIEGRIERMVRVIESAHAPEVEIGPHCNSPYPCPLVPLCWKRVDETRNSIFRLARIGAKAWPLFRDGVETTGAIPRRFRLTPAQKIQVNAEKSGSPHVNARAAAKFLALLEYPVHYLDFETFQTAIPTVDGMRPYQQVPFQFSLHVAASAEGRLRHESWIWDGQGDPRKALLEELQRVVEPRGSILAYGAAFERARIRECAQAYPQYQGWADDIRTRIIDLLQPFRSFSVYFPSQEGSASMKRVLPALTGRSYKDLAIQDGGQASIEFKRILFGGLDDEERRRIRGRLEEYCGLDTMGMVEIVRALGRLAVGRGEA